MTTQSKLEASLWPGPGSLSLLVVNAIITALTVSGVKKTDELEISLSKVKAGAISGLSSLLTASFAHSGVSHFINNMLMIAPVVGICQILGVVSHSFFLAELERQVGTFALIGSYILSACGGWGMFLLATYRKYKNTDEEWVGDFLGAVGSSPATYGLYSMSIFLLPRQAGLSRHIWLVHLALIALTALSHSDRPRKSLFQKACHPWTLMALPFAYITWIFSPLSPATGFTFYLLKCVAFGICKRYLHEYSGGAEHWSHLGGTCTGALLGLILYIGSHRHCSAGANSFAGPHPELVFRGASMLPAMCILIARLTPLEHYMQYDPA